MMNFPNDIVDDIKWWHFGINQSAAWLFFFKTLFFFLQMVQVINWSNTYKWKGSRRKMS